MRHPKAFIPPGHMPDRNFEPRVPARMAVLIGGRNLGTLTGSIDVATVVLNACQRLQGW